MLCEQCFSVLLATLYVAIWSDAIFMVNWLILVGLNRRHACTYPWYFAKHGTRPGLSCCTHTVHIHQRWPLLRGCCTHAVHIRDPEVAFIEGLLYTHYTYIRDPEVAFILRGCCTHTVH